MRLILLGISALFVLSSAVFSQESQNSLQLIQSSLSEGRITEDEAMDLKTALLEGAELPEAYRSHLPVKCGLPIVAEHLEYTKKRPEKRKTFQKANMQTVYNYNFTNKNGQQKTFRIHYDVSGPNAVPPADANTNAIPDWVDETALACEHSYRLEVDTLGYREPLSFQSFGYYEIFILDLNNVYGYTDALLPAITNNPDTYASNITVENDYVEGFATHGYDALRVTIGHEFFHAIQFSYNFRVSDTWYYELSSTWMEDVTYDNVNDYYAYLSTPSQTGYFDNPSVSLDHTDGYSVAHWNMMIEKKYGRGTIKKSWENMITLDALTSIDNAIKSATSSVSSLVRNFSEFAIWNYYTATRADSINYFPEARHYPKIKLLANRGLLDTMITRTLPHLAANYYSFYTSDTISCTLKLQAPGSNDYFELYTIEYNKATGKNIFFNHGGASSVDVTGLLPGDTLTCVMVNIVKSDQGQNFAYGLTVTTEHSGFSADPISNFHFYPSPFVLTSPDDRMNFKFVLGKASDIEFKVFSIDGKLMRKVRFGGLQAGPYDGNAGLYWDGRDSDGKQVPSGVYIYQFTGSGFKKTGKIAVVR